MIALAATIFLASLLGSLHCAGMCGAFVLFAIGAGDPNTRASKKTLMAAYHAGRLATYVGLGAVAGMLGSVVDLTGNLVGLQRAAAIGAGVLMVGFGVITLLRVSGVKIKQMRLPGGVEKAVSTAHRRTMALPPMGRAVATGLLTTLLPCGWLYAFVITAAGTAHAATGALVMAAFWTGTLPALTVLGLGIQKLSAPLAKRLPAITASAIVAVGLYTIAARAQVQLSSHIDPRKPPCCQTEAKP